MDARYETEAPLGKGDLAETWLARDRLSGAQVVIKRVRRTDDGQVLQREFEALRGLSHPSLVEVLDFGYSAGDERLPFLVTRYLQGPSLKDSAGQQSVAESVSVLADAVSALAQLHLAGIRHGDFKPENILQTDGGGVLIDLSCSAPLGEPLTEVSGTPGYLAPELARGRADHRSDLYAVGVSLRELAALAGEALPEPLRKLAERLTRPDPRARPSDASEVLEALGRSGVMLQPLLSPKQLLGRERELSFLEHWLEHLVLGRAKTRSLVLSGPPGSGRSRLLRELKWRAQRQLTVIEGSARRPGVVFEMLAAASRKPPPRHLAEVLACVEQLSNAETPILLLLDDTSELNPGDRQAWLALGRSIEPTAALGVVSVETSPIRREDHEPNFEEVTLGALSARAVQVWLKDHLPRAAIERAIAVTAGLPAQLETLVAQLAAGEITEDQLNHGDVELLGARARARLAGLSVDELKALTLASIAPGSTAARSAPQRQRDKGATGFEGTAVPDVISNLVQLGLLSRQGSGYQPLFGYAELALEICPEEIQRELRLELAERALHADGAREQDVLVAARHLALAGELGRVCELLKLHEARVIAAPVDWLPAVQPLLTAKPQALRAVPVLGLLQVERLLRDAGRPREALAVIARLLVLSPDRRPELRLAAAAGLLQLGDVRRAERSLSRSGVTGPRALEIAARCKLRSGHHREAQSLADSGLKQLGPSSQPGLRASLLACLGVALSYLGETDAADTQLKVAGASFESSGQPREQLRALSYRALNAYRAGRTEQAATEYRRVLELAEQHGLGEQIANAALNYGVACHQAGDLGAALDSYQRGLRLGTALGQVSVTVALGFNLAKLYADVGSLDRAELHLTQLTHRASRHELDFWLTAAASLRGELALARKQYDGAREAFQEALRGFARAANRREQAEVELHLAETELAAWQAQRQSLSLAQAGGERAALPLAVEAHLAQARALLQPLEAGDVRARLTLTEARAELCAGAARAATTRLEDALPSVRESGQLVLLAEVESLLAKAWDAAGGASLAQRAEGAARESWERVAASLPRGLRASFWSQEARSGFAPGTLSPGGGESRAAKLERLLIVNRKLNSSVTTQEVLAVAIDSAIELTGAERGFVLLAEAGSFSVSVARNVDRERIGRSHLKFSRSIAEQAVASGEPVLTVDASSDPRFLTNQSVHAMQLKSVVCVPIRSPEQTLGALYLDNRFRPANFDEADMGLLLAFADQVAIALTNARLHDELRLQAEALFKRTGELETERARVAELAEGQAREIDRLTGEVSRRQAALESRYDYGQIVGKSPSMERLFAKLDRVIETNATVIIEGESGTGKELVARAIHFNSPRKDAPFVAINCSAVPASLLESELFGHLRGAFTGADRDRKGLLASARGGTVFLDEIGETPLDMQAKLLRALEEREVRPIGGSKSVRVDFRLVCATNRHLRDEVASGRFREDLFYRISVVELSLPPLRDRGGDLLLVAERLLERICKDLEREPKLLSKDAAKALLGYSWPGNVRELENVLTNAVLLAPEAQLRAADLHLPGGKRGERKAKSRREFEATEVERISEALAAHRWNVSAVSRALRIPRATLYRKLKRYGLTPSIG